jgi:hypothetical protein
MLVSMKAVDGRGIPGCRGSVSRDVFGNIRGNGGGGVPVSRLPNLGTREAEKIRDRESTVTFVYFGRCNP